MNITETIQVYVLESTVNDGRWLFIDANPTDGVLVNTTARTAPLGVPELRKLRAIVDHLIEAEEVTNASVLAAVAAEFAE